MLRSSVGIGALLVAMGVFLCGGEVQASGVSNVLPNGGINIALAKGTALESISKEAGSTSTTITNIVTVDEMDEHVAKLTEAQRQAKKDEELSFFKNLVIAQVNDYVNVRSLPSEEGEIIGKLYDDSVGHFIEETDGWYKITSGTVTGYVKGEYCVTGDDAVALAAEVGTRFARVTCDGLFVRKEAGADSPILGMVAFQDELVVYEENDEWIYVDTAEGKGYVSAEYVELFSEFVEAESKEEEAARLAKEREEREKARAAARAAAKKNAQTVIPEITGDSEMGKAVAEYAVQFVGNPYKWGGTSLTNGADCSGFVLSVYANFGVSLPHSSAADRKQGYAVASLDEAQPGDLICYSGHVALYIGDGQIVHASSAKTGIIISKANYKNILAIRRIF